MTTTLFILGDLHLTDNPVKSSILKGDAFLEEQMRRLSEVEEDIKSTRPLGPCLVLLPGDVIDRWRSSPKVMYNLSWWLTGLQARRAEIYTTLGQHDVRGHDMEYWGINSYLSLMQSQFSGILLDGDCKRSMADIWVTGHEFTGAPDQFADQTSRPKHIALWHVSASDQPNPTTADIRTLKMPGQITVCGDIHNFCNHLKVDGADVFAAGSLIPMNNGDQNSRPPLSCGYWKAQVTKTLKVTSAEFVRFTDQLEQYYDPEIKDTFETPEHLLQNVDEMAEHIRRMREETSLSDRDIVQRVALAHDVDLVVVDHLLQHLED